MTQRLDDLPPCSACGGKLFPLVLCDACGAATILRDSGQVDWAAACPECGTFNPWQLICDQCHSRFPAPGVAAQPPSPAPETPKAEAQTPAAPPGRPKRRIKGEFDTRALLDMLKVLGLDPARSQALIDRGYDALWKIARAKPNDVSRIPEIGPVAARKMFESFHLLNYSPPQRTKELIAQDEYECPLCRCVTSAFAPACLECGATFDEEEMDESIREEFAAGGDAALLAFYDGRLAEKPNDPDLLYSRGLLLETMGRFDEAAEALEHAAAGAPDAKKIKVVELRVRAKQPRKQDIAEKLRSTASALLDDVAWDQEVAQLDQLISGEGPVCPSCGVAVPREAAVCASCGARLSGPPAPAAPVAVPAPRTPVEPSSPELDILVDDLLVGELEESLTSEELERTKAAVLDWLIEELEDSMAADTQDIVSAEKPPEKPAPAEASSLASSVGFLSSWMRGSRGLVSGLRPKQGIRGSGKVNGLVDGKGRVNGLVNGMGRVNGLVNGVGRVNGLVNGLGRVNGLSALAGRVNGLVGVQGRINGFVNGSQFVRSGTKGIRLSSPSRRVRYAAIAAGTLIAIIIVGLLFVPIPGPSTLITIDGSFDDWTSVPTFHAATVASDANVSIAGYADLLDHDSLYLYASTTGGMFSDTVGYTGVYFLIDADGVAATGFAFDGIGADAVIDVFGANHRVEGARLYSFPADAEVNWSQRQAGGSLQAAASAAGLEVRVSTYNVQRFDPQAFRISVYADDFRGSSSRSKAPLTPDSGAVLLEIQPLSYIVGGGSTRLFDIGVRGLGMRPSSSWLVSNLTLTLTPGVLFSLSAESVVLTQGQPNATIQASVSAPGFFPGDAVELNVTGANATVPVFVDGGPVRAYVMSAPSVVRIDGLFADWIGKDTTDSDTTPVNDSDVDIVRYGAAVNASAVFFHVSVAGDLLAGRLPERTVPVLPSQGGNGSGGPPVPIPRQTGEDILRVYIDLNTSNSQGDPFNGIDADYLFEIRGDGGRIRTRSLLVWAGAWTKVSLPAVALEKDATDIEGSLALGPTTNRTRVVFATTDWSGIGDVTPPANATVQAPVPLFQPGVIINAPEFHDIALPVAGTLLVILISARRRRHR